jgi:hypothetical protein
VWTLSLVSLESSRQFGSEITETAEARSRVADANRLLRQCKNPKVGSRATDRHVSVAHWKTVGDVVAPQARNGPKRRYQPQQQCVKTGADLAQGRQKGAEIKRKGAKKGQQTQCRVTGHNEP